MQDWRAQVTSVSELLESAERTISARFMEAEQIPHLGDRGENRELLLREFLEKYLPTRYGLTKGHVITRSGDVSYSADIIVYDRQTCPVFYSGVTSILPIEGVYGIIEVKSSLSKAELVDAARKVETFKKLAPRELGVVDLGDSVTVRRGSRPFGIVFGYQVADNSLASLRVNVEELQKEIHLSNYFVNLVSVLGSGSIYNEGIRWDKGEKFPLIDTDQSVRFFEDVQFDQRRGVDVDHKYGFRVVLEPSETAFGRFLSYLQIILSRMALNSPDIGAYLGAGTPPLIVRER